MLPWIRCHIQLLLEFNAIIWWKQKLISIKISLFHVHVDLFLQIKNLQNPPLFQHIFTFILYDIYYSSHLDDLNVVLFVQKQVKLQGLCSSNTFLLKYHTIII